MKSNVARRSILRAIVGNMTASSYRLLIGALAAGTQLAATGRTKPYNENVSHFKI
ncbi:hypothetical protein [Paraburkholderia fynbosensis]|uniref:hypothetical protein n=1 Tax=Paraburkholderia fynbosensis TaxID=1200993 RepID=UPI001C2E0788|nr:hypothetical protein [Paraburkholderia fynbosensis]